MAIITFPYPDAESLCVEYLMSICRSEGHQVEYLYYKNFNILFNKRHEPDFEDLARKIVQKGTHVAAFSCMTHNFTAQLTLARAVKRQAPNIVCLFGGVHVKSVPEKVFSHGTVDCIALGEADQSLPELLRAMTFSDNTAVFPDKPVTGMVFKKNSKRLGKFEPPEFPSPEKWPVPHKDPIYREMPEARNTYFILSSRGCPYSCSYCHNSSSYLAGKKKAYYRQQTVSRVISELKWAKASYCPQSVWFADDCFTADSRWISSFCREYRSKIGLPFACFAHPLNITDEKAKTLADAGCYCVQLGVQSLSKSVRKNIDRKGCREDVLRAMVCLKKSKILVAVDHILGLPGDSLQIQEDSLRFYNEHRPFWITALWLTYYPGTKIVETSKKSGLLNQTDIERIEDGLAGDQGYLIAPNFFRERENYYCIAFLMNWMPFLPKSVVRWLIKTRHYRMFRTNNYFLTVLLPRGIRSFHPRFPRRGFHLRVLFRIFKDTIGKFSNFFSFG